MAGVVPIRHPSALLVTLLGTAALMASLAGGAPINNGEAAGPRTPPPPASGYLQAPGGPFMTDQSGRKLEFHGFNLVGQVPLVRPEHHRPRQPLPARTE